jgi:beta-phosphoglucomutase-like phosphatase (HAD superfamily)
MTPSSPTAVIFDLDGTLVDTTYLHALAWWRASVAAGHDLAFSGSIG